MDARYYLAKYSTRRIGPDKAATKRRAPSAQTPRQCEIDDLPSMGWVRIESAGEENIYFVAEDGTRWFIKID